MAYANDFSTDPSNGWDAVSVMNGDYADPHNRFTAHPGMPQEIGMSPAATLARARMQNEYDLGITPSDAGPRPIAMRGSSPSGPRPSQSSGPMGMGRSLDQDYYGRVLSDPIARAMMLRGGGAMPTDPGAPPPAPLYPTNDFPAEPQKIAIKFASEQPSNVKSAFGGKTPQDIDVNEAGTISNTRQQFLDDISHLNSPRPDPSAFGSVKEYASALRDYNDQHADVMSRAAQHADEARRIGNTHLANAFDALSAGATPQEAAMMGTGMGGYRMLNAQTSAQREQRLGGESQQRLDLAQQALQQKAAALGSKLPDAQKQFLRHLDSTAGNLAHEKDALISAMVPADDPRMADVESRITQHEQSMQAFMDTLASTDKAPMPPQSGGSPAPAPAAGPASAQYTARPVATAVPAPTRTPQPQATPDLNVAIQTFQKQTGRPPSAQQIQVMKQHLGI